MESFKEIFMNLKDWKSNAAEVNKVTPCHDGMKGTVIKLLGLQWNTESDHFNISILKFQKISPATTTRQVLTTISSLFDPLGYLLPATMKTIQFLQKLWNEGKDLEDDMGQRDIGA